MGRRGCLAGILLFLAFEAAPIVGAQSPIFEKRSVCELVTSPLQFSGRLVSVRAELTAVREMLLGDVINPSCGPLASDVPESPDVRQKPGFTFIRDQSFEDLERGFQSLAPTPSGARGRVVATFEGRFDWTPLGSGHMKQRDTRLVLHRVRDVDVTAAR
jgi:hypothetical protein